MADMKVNRFGSKRNAVSLQGREPRYALMMMKKAISYFEKDIQVAVIRMSRECRTVSW